MITNKLEIYAPESIVFTYRLAGPTIRVVAYLLDLIFRVILFAILMMLIFSLPLPIPVDQGLEEMEDSSTYFLMGLVLILQFLIEWGYYVFFEVMMKGQSPGKRLCKIRVIKSEGQNIQFFDSIMRNLLRSADILPLFYGIGVLSILLSKKFQRLGDIAADTIVVYDGKYSPFAPSQKLETSNFPNLIPAKQLSPLSNKDISLIGNLINRSSYLTPARLRELAAILAFPISQMIHIPYSDPYYFLCLVYVSYQTAAHQESLSVSMKQENSKVEKERVPSNPYE